VAITLGDGCSLVACGLRVFSRQSSPTPSAPVRILSRASLRQCRRQFKPKKENPMSADVRELPYSAPAVDSSHVRPLLDARRCDHGELERTRLSLSRCEPVSPQFLLRNLPR
jgi:hypothetical protein